MKAGEFVEATMDALNIIEEASDRNVKSIDSWKVKIKCVIQFMLGIKTEYDRVLEAHDKLWSAANHLVNGVPDYIEFSDEEG